MLGPALFAVREPLRVHEPGARRHSLTPRGQPVERAAVRVVSTDSAFAVVAIVGITTGLAWSVTDMHSRTFFATVSSCLKLFASGHSLYRVLVGHGVGFKAVVAAGGTDLRRVRGAAARRDVSVGAKLDGPYWCPPQCCE